MLVCNAGAKSNPHKLLRTVEKRSRVLFRRQTLPACGHARTFSVRTKLLIDGGAGNSGTDAPKSQNDTVESYIVLIGGFQTSSFSS